MYNLLRLLFICSVLISFCHCKPTSSKTEDQLANNSRTPEFADKGNAIDNLKRQYLCETVEYENWEPDDLTDSSLTVCFINSKRVPEGDADKSFDQFKSIALQVRNAVVKPQKYKSYYIIFVKRETVYGMTQNVHSAGADIPSKEL
jgi:hypothetical protein